jgi:hypothetical protein
MNPIRNKMAPIAIPQGLTRLDVLYYICQAIEGSPQWAAEDYGMNALVDALMTSKDIYATLERLLPDAEWEKAYELIATRAPHHSSYKPPALKSATNVRIITNSGKVLIDAEVHGGMAYFDAWLRECPEWKRDPAGWHSYICGEGQRFYVVPAL